jgi:hypothetical protein
MYLETTRAVGAVGSKSPCLLKPVPQKYWDFCGITPPIPTKPKFKTAYSLTGTPPSKDWFYPACNAGYTKQQVNKPHPQMYSCFDPAELAWNKKYGIVM